MTELLPCPFCGAEGIVCALDGYRPSSPKTYKPFCSEDCGMIFGIELETEAEAIAAWNRRAPLTQAECATLTARIAELEAELELSDGMLQQVGTESNMIFDRGAQRLARIKELEAALAQAQAGRWMPLPDGLHFIEDNNDVALTVSLSGSLLTMHATDDELHNILALQLDPKQYRLCRWQEGSEA